MKHAGSTALVVVRARTDNELAAMIGVRTRADPSGQPPRLDNLRNNLSGNPDLAYFVAKLEDLPVGCGFVDVAHPTAARAHALVVPEARGRGVGSALLAALSERAREGALAALEGTTRANDKPSLEYFARRGYEMVGGDEALTLELAEVEGDCGEPPAGIRIVSRAEAPNLVEGMYAVACEAEPDIPGESAVRPYNVWRATEIERPSLDAELTFVAIARAEVVGYAILDSLAGEPWHRLTAVKRAWRRRGIATALKQAQIHAAKEKGFGRLVTSNEERNVGMRSVNEGLGYRPEPSLSTVVLRGPLLLATAAGTAAHGHLARARRARSESRAEPMHHPHRSAASPERRGSGRAYGT